MSEFSDSFHLRSSDPAHAVALLQRARVPGFVYPAANGFVTFVCPRDKDFYQAVVGANLGLLVDYSFAEDHGCWVNVYERDVKVANLSAAFEEERSRFDRDAFIDIGLADIRTADEIARWVRGAHEGDHLDGIDHFVARKLHLPRFAWLSYGYELANETPLANRIEVDRRGAVRSAEEAAKNEIDELLATLPPTRKKPGAPPAKAKAKAKANGKASTKVKAKPKTRKSAARSRR